MIGGHLREELGAAIMAGLSLGQIIPILQEYRRQGITRDEARDALEALRECVTDEAVEDRILEVLDIVSGFCAREQSVWEA